MKIFIFSAIILILFVSDYSLSQSIWTKQNYSPIRTYYSSVRFIDHNTGYIISTLGNCVVLKTTDGGNKWIDHSKGLDQFNISFGHKVNLWSNYFISNNTGWAIGEYTISDGSINKVILKTTNSGDEWNNLLVLSKSYLHNVYFFDENIGWIIGAKGSIIKTTNGGVNWNTQKCESLLNLYSIYFLNNSSGWIIGENGLILNTTNGGNNWNTQKSLTTSGLQSIFFINKNLGWIVGNNGTIIKTIDGGKSWISNIILSESNLTFSSINFIDSNIGWIAGSGQYTNMDPVYGIILKTIDGGESWTTQIFERNSFSSICFIDYNTGWVTGSAIFKTITGSSDEVESNENIEIEEQNEINYIDHSPMIESYLFEMEKAAMIKAKSLHQFSNIEDVSSDEYYIDVEKDDYVKVYKKYYIDMKGSILGVNKYKVILNVIASFENLQNGQWRSSIIGIEIISN